MKIQQHLNLLGHRVKDRVTGATGVVSSVAFDLYGCVQAIVDPGLDKDGKAKESRWYDVARLVVTSRAPVMSVPNFLESPQPSEGKKGPAEKPAQ